MANTPDKYARRRARTSAISTVVGIALVLFMLGLLSLLLLNAKALSTYVKENIQFQVFLNEGVKEAEIQQLQKQLDSEPYIRSTTFVSADQAAEDLKNEIGEDFVEFLGYNPLSASIDLKMNAEYAHPDSIKWIVAELSEKPVVSEVVYSPNLIRQVNDNINKISLVILGFSLLLLIIAIALINNTIRLAIYSKRFIIRSMQLVGATRGFIQRPFIGSGIVNGIYAGVIAVALIAAVLYGIHQQLPEIFEITDLEMFLKLLALVILLGIFISGISTLLAVRKYLRMNIDKIF